MFILFCALNILILIIILYYTIAAKCDVVLSPSSRQSTFTCFSEPLAWLHTTHTHQLIVTVEVYCANVAARNVHTFRLHYRRHHRMC